jgi:hypothetical protein
MSNQIVISSGAKVRSLEGVLTGTAGIVNSVPLGGANGVATLDSSGKVPLSQLPSSVITYLGTWNASTNTPTLTNGVGDDGDLYICNVAGTVNFGAGPITFAVGDWVIYGSSTWQKSAGASGTVTSVAVSSTENDAISITGSPITTSGTINIGFTGTSAQYVNGAGDLTTFPSLTGYVPYTGATANLDLGTFDLTTDIATLNQVKAVGSGGLSFNSNSGTQVALMGGGGGAGTTFYGGIIGTSASFASNGGSDTFAINHSSGSGISLNITKGGNGEGLYINKTSGSGNAATIIGTLNATTLVKNGGTSSQYLMADGSVSTGPDLTGYVTLATTQTITGSKTFSSVIGGDAGISLKEGVVPSGVGYTGLAGDADGLLITKRVGATAYTNLLYFNSATSNTYTFPNLSGTLALLEGTQTFSGVKTFDAALNLKVGAGAGGTGYIGLGSMTANTLVVYNTTAGTTYSQSLAFPTGAGNTYTFPNADGTIALTSNFANYVSLDGNQTIIGIKTFNNDTIFNGAVDVNNSINLNSGVFFRNNAVGSTLYTNFSILKSGSLETLTYLFTTANSSKLVFNDAANYTYTFPTTSGTIVLGTGTTNYLPKFTGASTLGDSVIQEVSGNIGIGGSPSGSYKFEVTGASKISGFLGVNGSPATSFPFEAYINSSTAYSSTSRGNVMRVYNSNTGANVFAGIELGGAGTANDGLAGLNAIVTGSGSAALTFYTRDGGTFAERLRVAANGNVGIGTSVPQFTLALPQDSKVGWNDAGSAKRGSITVNSSADAMVFATGTSDTERMRITSGGNVGIGTSSPGVSLEVNGLMRSVPTYNNTTASAANLVVSSGGTFERSTASSQIFKENIIEWDGNGLDTILALKPKTFTYKEDYYSCPDRQFLGLIAEEVAEVSSYLADFENEDGTGQVENVRYANIVVPLIKAIQELEAKVSALENKS